MKYWKIVSGHHEPGFNPEPKSVLLGDWLRREYVGIGKGYGKDSPIMKRFMDEMTIGEIISEVYIEDKETQKLQMDV